MIDNDAFSKEMQKVKDMLASSRGVANKEMQKIPRLTVAHHHTARRKKYNEAIESMRSITIKIPDSSSSRKAVEEAKASFDRLKQLYNSQ